LLDFGSAFDGSKFGEIYKLFFVNKNKKFIKNEIYKKKSFFFIYKISINV